ncbi:MAG: MFS transporter [Anaerolineae bacterium]|nr:MFS transporter [Anaerolineae bacterium]
MQNSIGFRRLVTTLFYRDGLNIFSVMSVSDFRHLWAGQMISFVGDALAYNTMTLAIIRMADDAGEKSGMYLSTLFVLSALPSLFLGIVAGTLVDRANRKHIMITADVIRGFLALGFLLVHDLNQIWIFIAVSVFLSTVSTFFFPARTAIMPLMLDKEQLLAANALAQLTTTLAVVVGAAIAGVLVGIADATAPAFIADSLSFFLSALFIARISISGRVTPAPDQAGIEIIPSGTLPARHIISALRKMAGEMLVGLRYVFSDRVMRGVLISFLALFLGLGAANITFVPLLIDDLGMPEEGLGVIRFSQTLGIILSSAITAAVAVRYRARDLIGMSMLVFGSMTFLVSIITDYTLMVGVLFLVGLTLSPPQIVASTLVQQHVPSEKLGRASGAQGTIVNVANIASMGAAGFLMDRIGARGVFTISAVLISSAGIVSWFVLRGVENEPAQPVEENAAAILHEEKPAPPVASESVT